MIGLEGPWVGYDPTHNGCSPADLWGQSAGSLVAALIDPRFSDGSNGKGNATPTSQKKRRAP